MNAEFIIAIIILALNTADGGPYPPQQRAQAGLNFAASVQQAKDQMRYFLAGEKPIHDSIDKLEDYYVDVKEKDMRKLHPRKKLGRPCKVLPDPQPGLVNPKLVAPVHRYKPLRKDEKFYGKFAPPLSYEMLPLQDVTSNDMVAGSLPPVRRSYPGLGPVGPNPLAAGPVPNPYAYPVIQKQTVYAPNPFFGYKGDYRADNIYFRKDNQREIVETSDPYHRSRSRESHKYKRNSNFASTATFTGTSWKSHLNTDYSQRISSMSGELASNSAAIISMSFSNKMASVLSHFSKKEASLRSKLSSKSATITATKTKEGWHW